jgi:hypothetical protein
MSLFAAILEERRSPVAALGAGLEQPSRDGAAGGAFELQLWRFGLNTIAARLRSVHTGESDVAFCGEDDRMVRGFLSLQRHESHARSGWQLNHCAKLTLAR